MCANDAAPLCCCVTCADVVALDAAVLLLPLCVLPLALALLLLLLSVTFACFEPPGTPVAALTLVLLAPADEKTWLADDDADVETRVLEDVAFALLGLALALDAALTDAFPADGAPLRTIPFAGVTAPSSPSAFWYADPPSSSATLAVVHPLLWMSGHASMNAVTVLSFSSCSRMMSPGLLGPEYHLASSAWTDARVPPPGWPMLQSPVLCHTTSVSRNGERTDNDALLIPHDRLHAKDRLSDGDDAVIGVTVWGTPILWKTTTGGVVDELHGPPKLAEHVFVAQGGHVRMGPCVDGDVVPVVRVRHGELVRVLQNIDTDEKMGRSDVVLLQERVQLVRALGE